ncbi:MAG: dicarboxylate/amino acid:cation symporter [Brevinema sp.]
MFSLIQKIKFGLLSRLILAIVCGVLVGTMQIDILIRILLTFNGLFSELLKFSVPLIILAFITNGIADLGYDSKKILGITLIVSYTSSITMGFVALGVDMYLFPKILSDVNLIDITKSTATLKPFFTIIVPPVFSIITALVLSFVLGIGISKLKNSHIKNNIEEFNQVIAAFLENFIIPLLPLYILGVFANMTHTGQVTTVLSSFVKVFAVVLPMQFFVIILFYSIAGMVTKKNPYKLIRNMIPAYLTALGTQSSVATIPMTVQCSKSNGVSSKIAEFTASLCANTHMPGSIISLTSCALAVMILFGIEPSVMQMIPFIIMLGIITVSSPGIPGGAVVAAIGILQSMLGFDESMLALIIALHVAQDSFGTACNVTSDGALALMLDNQKNS